MDKGPGFIILRTVSEPVCRLDQLITPLKSVEAKRKR